MTTKIHEYKIGYLANHVGFLQVDLTEEELKPIKDEIKNIQESFDTSTPHKDLAGNLEKEYTLILSKEAISKLLKPYIIELQKKVTVVNDIVINQTFFPYSLTKLWVNFMKKHEFNPIHIHSGTFSFVLWINIPYDINEEMVRPSNINSNSCFPGNFQFVFYSPNNQIETFQIPADKRWNNRLIVFPANLNHQVYPFYTSDDYRISVSGNFEFDVTEYFKE
jgi:hypothetical protein